MAWSFPASLDPHFLQKASVVRMGLAPMQRPNVNHNRVASAVRVIAEGKLGRSFSRWQEVHRSARVKGITRLRAEAHARRKILGKFWLAWMEARDLHVCVCVCVWQQSRGWGAVSCIRMSIFCFLQGKIMRVLCDSSRSLTFFLGAWLFVRA